MSYVIRYATLDSHLIYNYAGPGYGRHYCSKEERKKFAQQHVDCRNQRDNFFNNLEQSILKNGFRNPVVVQAGYLPPTTWRNMPPYLTEKGLDNVLVCMDWGGSRLWVAQKHNLEVPCLILDFVGRFKNERWLKTMDDIRSVFTDKPDKIVLEKNRFNMKTDVNRWLMK